MVLRVCVALELGLVVLSYGCLLYTDDTGWYLPLFSGIVYILVLVLAGLLLRTNE